jgi:hypothetical protein
MCGRDQQPLYDLVAVDRLMAIGLHRLTHCLCKATSGLRLHKLGLDVVQLICLGCCTLTDANEEGDEDMRRSFVARLAPKRTHLAIWLE